MTYVHLMEAFGTLGGGQVRYLKTTNPLEPPYLCGRQKQDCARASWGTVDAICSAVCTAKTVLCNFWCVKSNLQT